MSRIYEALQKAEMERLAERRERPTNATVTSDEIDSYAPYAPVAVAEAEDEATVVADLHTIEEEKELVPAIASKDVLNLDAVRRFPWTPSLERLPALQDRGAAVEQLRSLRSRIFELRDLKPLKSILVSSGLPQEGKSFIAANLAVSLARHRNSKVLLIDGDMRRYTAHQLLGCDSHPGLADYLSGKAGIVEVMQRAEQTPREGVPASALMPNLTFIPGGNGGDNSADLSGNPRFGELIRQVSPYFDWVIVDSSPVIPVSDAVNLARSCDGVLLVARGGVTKFPVAQRAQSELKASNILGFVLNGVLDTPTVGSYYGYGYDATTE